MFLVIFFLGLAATSWLEKQEVTTWRAHTSPIEVKQPHRGVFLLPTYPCSTLQDPFSRRGDPPVPPWGDTQPLSCAWGNPGSCSGCALLRCAEAPGVPTISCPSLGCSAVGKDEYFGDNLILPLCLLCRNCFCALQLGRRIATSGDLKASQWAQQEADPDLFRQVPAKSQRPFPPWKSSLLFLPMPSSHVDSEELFSSPTAGNSLLHCSAGDKRLFCLERT